MNKDLASSFVELDEADLRTVSGGPTGQATTAAAFEWIEGLENECYDGEFLDGWTGQGGDGIVVN